MSSSHKKWQLNLLQSFNMGCNLLYQQWQQDRKILLQCHHLLKSFLKIMMNKIHLKHLQFRLLLNHQYKLKSNQIYSMMKKMRKNLLDSNLQSPKYLLLFLSKPFTQKQKIFLEMMMMKKMKLSKYLLNPLSLNRPCLLKFHNNQFMFLPLHLKRRLIIFSMIMKRMMKMRQ